ncbi:Arrestin-related trafficking adapter 10 [Coniochaeta hoffmannii]|uniref:Arrestin-related trafficking adapter 10 n=1 Tax=Coniochaeta hoffmannii TaxID=91930 RepID=A0AA38S9F5_9PEZI|nr:Arrestin-related trafficking adapter 10 [Coniochaeta hoffmannii]
MSLRIALDDAPEFYTNLDIIQGRIVLGLTRHEQIGAIIVKLEGESRTALAVPANDPNGGQTTNASSGNVVHENHKILYKVEQVFPDKNAPPLIGPIILAPGQHQYPFRFKVPFNNACGDPNAMARLGGLAGQGGFASGPGIFGLGGIRVMDGSKQLMYSHVTKTLPPSFTGFPRQAEIRYYIKVTIQRPGLFKENWRYNVGFKFLPIEPPRPPKTNQEAYARRPFTFRPRSPASQLSQQGKRSSFFGAWRSSSNPNLNESYATSSVGADGKLQAPSPQPPTPTGSMPPSIEMSARLPHPSILTCNKPIDLRLIAKKLAPAAEEVYLTSLQIDLIGNTVVRCQDLVNTEVTKWVVVSRHGLSIPVSNPSDPVGTEIIVPEVLWRDVPLPNTVMPSFITCNLSRDYQLEVQLGLTWGKPVGPQAASSNPFKNKTSQVPIPQTLHLPLHFSTIEVYSGLAPPPQLVEAMRHQGRVRPASTSTRPSAPRPARQTTQQQPPRPPAIPPRPTPQQAAALQAAAAAAAASDPLYPPQLAPGQTEPAYDDAPPSYDEAMAEALTVAPVVGDRPAYSGVTNENGPSTIPGGNEKS